MNIIAIKSVIDTLRSGVDPLLNPKGIIYHAYSIEKRTKLGYDESLGYILRWLDMGEKQYEVFLWLMEITLAKGSKYCADFFESYYKPHLDNYEAQKAMADAAKEASRKMIDRLEAILDNDPKANPADELKQLRLMDFQKKVLMGIITARQRKS